MAEFQARRFAEFVLSRGRALVHDEAGVTAIEFGVLALPFFTVILAIIQTAIMFLAMQVLDSAVEDASRKIRTGQAAGYSLDDFRTLVCASTYSLFDCSQIQLRSEVLADFSNVALNQTVQTCTTTPATCTWTSGWQSFSAGGHDSVMQVSAYYRYPLIVVLPYFNLKNQPDNFRLISAISVFRNEPY